MNKLLGHISTVQTGLFAKPVPDGEIAYVQARHFDTAGHQIEALRPDILSAKNTDKHRLQSGDVLYAAKGTRNFAAAFDANHNPPAVASTSFFVIRLKDNGILPEFLAWFLNHPLSQKKLKGKARGTSMVSISKATLEKLELPIPNLQTQKAILRIAQLRLKEKQIMRKIESLREQQIQHQIFNTLTLPK